MNNLGWPQWIILGFQAFGLLVMACLDGHDRTGKHSLAVRMLDSGIILGLLYWGGFFHS